MIDVTITATRRPTLLHQTLTSFYEPFFKRAKVRGIINVDPVGEEIDSRRVVDVCHEFFEEVVWNCPKEASFPKAFKWCWSQATGDFVFNLEDDWELKRPFPVDYIVILFKKYQDLVSVRLPAFPAGKESMKCWNRFFPWNGEFYEVPRDHVIGLGFCGHPSFLRGEFVKKVAPMLEEHINPEKQFHHHNQGIVDEVSKWRFGIFGEPNDPPTPPLVEDIGRRWMVENGWRKEGNKAYFTTWRRHEV